MIVLLFLIIIFYLIKFDLKSFLFFTDQFPSLTEKLIANLQLYLLYKIN